MRWIWFALKELNPTISFSFFNFSFVQAVNFELAISEFLLYRTWNHRVYTVTLLKIS